MHAGKYTSTSPHADAGRSTVTGYCDVTVCDVTPRRRCIGSWANQSQSKLKHPYFYSSRATFLT